jgi:hypothetical protein
VGASVTANRKYSLTLAADSNTTEEHGWALHEPDQSLYFAPHLRREFLLDNGERTVIGSRDLEADYSDAIFFTRRNGTLQKIRAVRELFGIEKTEALQHPSLRKAKRSFSLAAWDFAAVSSRFVTVQALRSIWDRCVRFPSIVVAQDRCVSRD